MPARIRVTLPDRAVTRSEAVVQLQGRVSALIEAFDGSTVELWRDWTGHLSSELWASPAANLEFRTRHGLNCVPNDPAWFPADSLRLLAAPGDFDVERVRHFLTRHEWQSVCLSSAINHGHRVWAGATVYDHVASRRDLARTDAEYAATQNRRRQHDHAIETLNDAYRVLDLLTTGTRTDISNVIAAVRYAFGYETITSQRGGIGRVTPLQPGAGWWASPLGGCIADPDNTPNPKTRIRLLGLPTVVTPATARLVTGTLDRPLRTSQSNQVDAPDDMVTTTNMFALRCRWVTPTRVSPTVRALHSDHPPSITALVPILGYSRVTLYKNMPKRGLTNKSTTRDWLKSYGHSYPKGRWAVASNIHNLMFDTGLFEHQTGKGGNGTLMLITETKPTQQVIDQAHIDAAINRQPEFIVRTQGIDTTYTTRAEPSWVTTHGIDM